MDWIKLAQEGAGQVTGCCEDGDDHSYAIKCGEILKKH